MQASGKGRLLGGLIFHAGMLISIVLWGTACLLTLPLPYRLRYWVISRWCHWILWWLRVTCGIRHEVEGLENIPRERGVVMAKHQSTWETFTLELWFYPQTWVLKRELMWLPVFGWCLAMLKPIAINRSDRRGAVRQIIEQGRRRLQEGLWVVVFPEGTRVPAGMKGRYGKGGAILACAAEAAVIPVAHNAGELWPRRGLRKYPGTIRVRIGEPIATRGRQPAEVIEEAERWIEAQMPEISGNGYSGELYVRGPRSAQAPQMDTDGRP